MRHCFTRKLTKRNSLEKAHNHFLTNISYLALQAFFISNMGIKLGTKHVIYQKLANFM